MKYKGAVFVLGVDMPESLKNMDKHWEKYFDDIFIEKPLDDINSFSTRGRGDVDIRPLVGKHDEDYVLVCPTTPSVLEKWGDKEIHGTVRQRAPLYMPDTDISIGLGQCGSYTKELLYGDIILPVYVENSEKLMRKGRLDIEKGYSDRKIQRRIQRALGAKGMDLWPDPGMRFSLITPDYRIYPTHQPNKMISLADIEEVIAQSKEDKKQRWEEGYFGSDMETGWFLGYSNSINKGAGSMLMVSDLPEDRPFEKYKTRMHEPENVEKKKVDWEKATEAAIECILGYYI